MNWLVRRKDADIGTFSTDELFAACQDGKVLPSDRVAAAEVGPWRSVGGLLRDMGGVNPQKEETIEEDNVLTDLAASSIANAPDSSLDFSDHGIHSNDATGLEDNAIVAAPVTLNNSADLDNPPVKKNWWLVGVIVAVTFLLANYFGTSVIDFLFGNPSGPPRYEFSGNIQFQGQNIPQGVISFSGEASGRRYSGHAGIINGRFDTRLDGRGHVGGPQEIIVTAFQQAATAAMDEEADINILFNPIEWTEDFPESNINLNIKLPNGVR